MSATTLLPLQQDSIVVRFGRWLRRDIRGALSLAFLLLLIVVALLAPWIAPYSPTEQDYANMLAEPSARHWLGTDDLGRDVFSRLIHGTASSLYAAFLAVGVAVLVGVPVGLVAGFMGGWVDLAISRCIDTLLSFPAIVLAVPTPRRPRDHPNIE